MLKSDSEMFHNLNTEAIKDMNIYFENKVKESK